MLYDTAALESFVAAAPAEIHHRYLSSFFPGRAHESGGRGSEFISRAAGCPNVNAAISRMSLSAGFLLGLGLLESKLFPRGGVMGALFVTW